MRCVSVTRRSCHLMCYQRSTNELTVNKPPFNYLLTQSFRPVSRPGHPIYRRPWLRLECHCWLYRTSYTSRRGARGAAGDVVVGGAVGAVGAKNLSTSGRGESAEAGYGEALASDERGTLLRFAARSVDSEQVAK